MTPAQTTTENDLIVTNMPNLSSVSLRDLGHVVAKLQNPTLSTIASELIDELDQSDYEKPVAKFQAQVAMLQSDLTSKK